MAEIAAGGYTNDTEAVAPGPDTLRRFAPVTERWLRLTGQEVNVGKSMTWTLVGWQAQPMRLLGAPIPIDGEPRSGNRPLTAATNGEWGECPSKNCGNKAVYLGPARGAYRG